MEQKTIEQIKNQAEIERLLKISQRADSSSIRHAIEKRIQELQKQ